MGRRRKNKEGDWILGVAQLAGAIFLLAYLSSGFRQNLAAFGTLLKLLIGVVVVIFIGWILVRYLTRSRKQKHPALPLEYEVAVHAPPSIPVTKPSTDNLVERLRAIDWFQFEKVIAIVYTKKGYDVTRRGGANPDGGIDLILEKDGVRTAVQCKQWKTWNVGVKGIREFLGALTDSGIPQGLFVTLCGYTAEAKQLAEKHGIEIVNEAGLIQLLKDTNARYDPDLIKVLNDDRKLCPKCEDQMVIRTAKKGARIGEQFWGCDSYPRCQFTMPLR